VAILVRNQAGEVYVHRRTPTKDVFPGMYDLVVGGMVTAGETYEEAANRELAEELGIEGVDLRFLLRHRYIGDRNNAWITLYEVVWEGPIRHQEEEISWGAFMSEEDLLGKLGEWPFAPDHLEVFQRLRVSSGPGPDEARRGG
jgi:8-oxo-dGTP pyrophosphatase MutT (NUDIX family)